MSVRWYSVVVDCHDVGSQARWWATVLGWDIVYEADDEVVIASAQMLGQAAQDRGPGLVFVPVPEAKQVKNRLHIDLAPPASSNQQAEVDRLVGLGATHASVGQDNENVSWVVLADPEGNEFCVLSARD
jgi:catechol 2,3-dioxygenase-like lactoylglutathione lyase family enzyme